MPRFATLGGLSPRLAVASLAVVAVAGVAWFVGRGASRSGEPRLAAVVCQRQAHRRPRAGADRRHAAHRHHDRTAGGHRGAGGRAALRAGRQAMEMRCRRAAGALSRAVSGQRMRCTADGTDGAGLTLAYCTAGDTDINGELVRKGHVFAEQSFLRPLRFAGAGSEERQGRAVGGGGDAERPSEYRAKAWEEAKRRAPGRLPDQGVGAGRRSRLRAAGRTRTTNGAACRPRAADAGSAPEREAVSAGFKAASRD